MKIAGKILLRILIAFLLIFIVILLIRAINSYRYPEPKFPATAQQELSAYPITDSHGTIEQINYLQAQGFHMKPKNKTSKGLVITFGGSEGGSNYDMAHTVYNQGYEVFALYFFGQENLSSTLLSVDISFFEDVKAYIETENIQATPLTLLGASKGAELILLLTQYYDDITNVVLYAPSAYVFQGLDTMSMGSSWAYKGVDLPYLSFNDASFKSIANMTASIFLNYPTSFKETYQSISEDATRDSLAWIYKTQTESNILIFAGGDDKMWHSAEMGSQIKKANPEYVELHIFEDAGHIFAPISYVGGLATGGTKDANISAMEESNQILFESLSKWHH